MGILERAKGRASELKGHATDLTTDAMEAGAGKVAEIIDRFTAALPILRSAGWALQEITCELGLPPKVVAKFKPVEQRTEAELDAIVAENADRPLALTLLKTLRQARKVSSRFQFRGLTTQEVAIGLGLIPLIEIKLA